MPQVERLREAAPSKLDAEYLRKMSEAGWRLTAIEWERDVASPERAGRTEEPPYGLQVAADCRRLEENAREQQALGLILELLSRDQPLREIAAELNNRGFRTRAGSAWAVTDVFNMLPRVIDAGPQLLAAR